MVSECCQLTPIKKPGKISIHHYCADFQGVGHIRVIFPCLLLNHLRLDGYGFHASYSVQYVNDPVWYSNYTLISFQRASTDKHLELIKHFKNVVRKRTKTPIFYELDDLLFDIPKWNYASEYYGKYRPCIEQILREVDGITVSTEYLKNRLSPYNSNISVIPNHLPMFLWGERPLSVPLHRVKREKVRIVWAGSENHFANKRLLQKDIRGGDFGNDLMSFIRKTTNTYDWHILGGCPSELSDLKNNGITYHGWRNIFGYPMYIRGLEPDIFIAPLEDNEFNRCKSDLKLLEACAVGAAGVYSNVEPYKEASLLADTDEQMISMIEQLASDIEYRQSIYELDLHKVRDVLYWECSDNVRRYIETYLGFFGKVLAS